MFNEPALVMTFYKMMACCDLDKMKMSAGGG